jgi:hypothetical protein
MPSQTRDDRDAQEMVSEMLSDADITREEAARLLNALGNDPTEQVRSLPVRKEVRRLVEDDSFEASEQKVIRKQIRKEVRR